MMLRSSPPRIRRRSSKGFVMFEALIALLICAMGILGVVGLQGSMTRAQSASTFRAEAAFQAQQLIGEIWSNRQNMAQYNTASCAAPCKAWLDRLAAKLPQGAATVAVDGAGTVAIEIRWAVPGESVNRYNTVTAVTSN
ncbi:pilus assembly protein PilV [Roseateles sp. DAIF2]|uniref:type IV pilus modification PilV family protein n=1 Tax=Roseateles sp. DAIF2 TaxID=2714952 RepID=UPI0018A280A0|nr:pilus assembly protein PilV [Roseateles sp. DAIF2]QPF72545.1 pilus assembly protein PilV [Roseateles sp. DAIF2]